MTIHPVIRPVRAFILLLCVMACFPALTAAQQVSGGVKAGVSLGDIPGFVREDLGFTSSMRVGFAAGGFAVVRFDNGFAIQPEVLYTQKGLKVRAPWTAQSTFTVKTDFLDIPVLARYSFGGSVRRYFFAGPSFDFRVSAKETPVPGPGTQDDLDISSDVKTFEFALVFGGGVELGPMLLEGRWSEGVTNPARGTWSGMTIKTRTVLVLGGLRF